MDIEQQNPISGCSEMRNEDEEEREASLRQQVQSSSQMDEFQESQGEENHIENPKIEGYPFRLYFENNPKQMTILESINFFKLYLKLSPGSNQDSDKLKGALTEDRIRHLNKNFKQDSVIEKSQQVFITIEGFTNDEQIFILRNIQGEILFLQTYKRSQKKTTTILDIKQKLPPGITFFVFDRTPEKDSFVTENLFKNVSIILSTFIYFKLITFKSEKKKLISNFKLNPNNQRADLHNEPGLYYCLKSISDEDSILIASSIQNKQQFQCSEVEEKIERAHKIYESFFAHQDYVSQFTHGKDFHRLMVYDSLITNYLKNEKKLRAADRHERQMMQEIIHDDKNDDLMLIQKLMKDLDQFRSLLEQSKFPDFEQINSDNHFPMRLEKPMNCKCCEIYNKLTKSNGKKRTKSACIACSKKYLAFLPLCLPCFKIYHENIHPFCQEASNLRQIKPCYQRQRNNKMDAEAEEKRREEEERKKAKEKAEMLEGRLIQEKLWRNFEDLQRDIETLSQQGTEGKEKAIKILQVLFIDSVQGITKVWKNQGSLDPHQLINHPQEKEEGE